METFADEIVESDVLIIGGGLGGSMAAIRAREHGAKVVLIEKGTIRRSGECGRGIDHYPFIAQLSLNGVSPEEYGAWRAQLAGLASTKLSVITAQEALKPLAVLEDIGVKIREENGDIVMNQGRWGGFFRTRTEAEQKAISKGGDFISYRGADIKIKLANEVRRLGCILYEHVTLTSFITKNGQVVGATGINIRDGRFIVFKCKAAILATGGSHRMYSYELASFPNKLFSIWFTPMNCGSGIAAAYKAGAELTNMEYCYVYVQGGGLGWGMYGQVGAKLMNSKKEELYVKYPGIRGGGKEQGGLYQTAVACYKPDIINGEIEKDVIWFDTSSMIDDYEYASYRIYANESPSYLGAMRERGGIRKAPREARLWLEGLPRSFSGIIHDESGESSLKGLYIVGDCAGGVPMFGTTGAFVWGYKTAKYAADRAKKMDLPEYTSEQLRQIKAERERVLAPLSRKETRDPIDCVDSLELEDLVRNIMGYYVGIKKVAPKLKRVQELLSILKEKFVPALKAYNPHELMRALEIQDIIDVCQIHASAAEIRTETRLPPDHFRLDYPEPGDDAHWGRNIVLRNVGGNMDYEFRARE